MSSTARFWATFGALAWYIVLWSFSLLGWHTAYVCLIHASSTKTLLNSSPFFVSRRKRYSVRPRSPLASSPPDQVPGVTIIRPLKGLDVNLFENLESTFTQDYPKFEILLAVADEDDAALPVIRDLVARYPDVDASIVIGPLHCIW